jgi:hypothetical protein
MAIEGRLAAWRIGAVAAALAVALLASPGWAEARAPAPRQADVTLGWSPGWTSTGLTVEPGDTLSISIRALQPPARQSLAFQREGGPTLGDRLAEAAALRPFVGRLGEGRAFPVGPKYGKVMTEGGLLWLRWNVPRELAGGREFSATVRIAPPPRQEGSSDGNNAATNGNAGANEANPVDTNTEAARPAEPVVDNSAADTPANDQNEASIATPPPVQPRPQPAGVDEDNSNDFPIAAEPSPSSGRLAILAPLAVGLLLVLAGAGLGLKQRPSGTGCWA